MPGMEVQEVRGEGEVRVTESHPFGACSDKLFGEAAAAEITLGGGLSIPARVHPIAKPLHVVQT